MLAHSENQQWGTLDFKMAQRAASRTRRGIHSPDAETTGTLARGLRAYAPEVLGAKAATMTLLLSQAFRAASGPWAAAPGTAIAVDLVNLPAVSAVLDAVAPSFAEMATLEAGWDSYGADPISPDALRFAKHLVGRVAMEYSWLPVADLTPYVLPIADGGIQLEWSGPNGRLDVEIGSERDVNYLLMLGTGDEETFHEHHGVSLEAVVQAAELMLGAA